MNQMNTPLSGDMSQHFSATTPNPVPESTGGNSAPLSTAVSAPASVPASASMSAPQSVPQSGTQPISQYTASSVSVSVSESQAMAHSTPSYIPQAPVPPVNIESVSEKIEDPINTPLQVDPNKEAVKKSQYFNNSIFWIETEKIVPNPYQPRKEFDAHALRDLSESIRMYGLLQPLVVTRREITKEDGGLATQYELISGERRLRASKLAGLTQVPVIIRAGEEDARVKLELAIIENLQREDLNPIDRARSFQRLNSEFGLTHVQIAEKVGKSREYVTNSIRLLALPEYILDALSEKKITEGHTRPLLMLIDRPQEQDVLFKEIMARKMTVREAERAARGVAVERIRKHDINPELRNLEKELNDTLGTRVYIEKKEQGGKVVIDFFNLEDVRNILNMLHGSQASQGIVGAVTSPAPDLTETQAAEVLASITDATPLNIVSASAEKDAEAGIVVPEASTPADDSTKQDIEDDGMYSIKNFSI